MKFKIFVCTALSFIILLQAVIASVLLYGSTKLKNTATSAQNTLNTKTNALTQSTSDINSNLQGIKTEIQSLNQNLTGRE